MATSSVSGLAEQALDNLVRQFARSFDFLRELVQNAMDAGTPRVEVWVQYRPATDEGDGIVEVHVDDFGAGMDEAVIDGQLTKMFSSTKEDDLTKIGKFGIGFTSVFAIEPDAVLLHTGRHGESWELLFRADRTFDKIRLAHPVDGTRITIFKRLAASGLDEFVRECLATLRRWCLHSDTPLFFGVVGPESAPEPAPQPADADPFAAFLGRSPVPVATRRPDGALGAVTWQRIDTPMFLEADLMVRDTVEGVEFIIGYGPGLQYGFYNGGLTLIADQLPSLENGHPHAAGALSFKVKYARLEHTLTRDNVLLDEHYTKARRVFLDARSELRRQLMTRLRDAARAGEPLQRWHRYVHIEVRDGDMWESHASSFADALPFRAVGDRVVTLAQLRAQERRLDCLLLESDDGDLDQALVDDGLILLERCPAALALLHSLDKRRFKLFGLLQDREILVSDRIFVLPQPLAPEDLPAQERSLLAAAEALIRQVAPGRIHLRAAGFGGPEAAADEAFSMHAPRREGPHRRDRGPGLRLPLLLRNRSVLINRHHATFRAHLDAWSRDRALGLAGLVQALLTIEGVTDHDVHRRVLDHAFALPRARSAT